MRRASIAALMVLVMTGAGRVVVPVVAQAGDVTVSVAYTGKGKVDDTHEIWVFLFDTPGIIGTGARPVATQTITKSGDSTTFVGVAVNPVYVAVAYDEKGDYDGNAAPPPSGTPIAFYSKDGKVNLPVTPGPAGRIKVTFDESRRMP